MSSTRSISSSFGGVERQTPSSPSSSSSSSSKPKGRINQWFIVGAFGLGFFLGTRDNDASSAKSQQSFTRRFLAADDEPDSTREVHVKSMCRCGSKALPVPGKVSPMVRDTGIVQPPSKATGMESKRFLLHPTEGEGCTCLDDHRLADATSDMFLSGLERKCPADKMQHSSDYDWNDMPDLGVEEKLPLFVGVLSYKSPLSLNGTLHNWLDHDLFRRIGAADVMVQLNKRSELDDQILDSYQQRLAAKDQPPVQIMGSPDENLHPGLAISKFCRAAEAHPNSHPNGENLLAFLEKDWNLYDDANAFQLNKLEWIFSSINSLAQRGVHYMRLGPPVAGVNERTAPNSMWRCPSEGLGWSCTTAHQHRWTNTPFVIDCSWFLRYLEPFALLDDPVMYGCRDGFQEARYCDWEEALQDGRVAWTDAQWVVANLVGPRPKVFEHVEVDQ